MSIHIHIRKRLPHNCIRVNKLCIRVTKLLHFPCMAMKLDKMGVLLLKQLLLLLISYFQPSIPSTSNKTHFNLLFPMASLITNLCLFLSLCVVSIVFAAPRKGLSSMISPAPSSTDEKVDLCYELLVNIVFFDHF